MTERTSEGDGVGSGEDGRLRVCVVGASGRMGAEVCRAVAAAGDLSLVAAVDRTGAGLSLGEAIGSAGLAAEEATLGVVGSLTGIGGVHVDVVVDFTVAEAARENLDWCATEGVHAVVGTTGLGPDDMVDLAARFGEGSSANCVIAPNFAVGAVLLMHFSKVASLHMDGAEVIELHHDKKRDAPSGTAVKTAMDMVAARQSAGLDSWPVRGADLDVVPGSRGALVGGYVPVHAVRLPGLVAHQEVIFGAPGQGLTLRHDAYDRKAFMPGVLLAIREVPRRRGLTVGLEALLRLGGIEATP